MTSLPVFAPSRVLKKDYDLLFSKSGKRVRTSYHTFFYHSYCRLACKVAAKKKTGNAVRRNQHKRRLRCILKGIAFKDNYLVLGVLVRDHHLSFAEEKKIVYHSLRNIVDNTAAQ